MVRTQDPKFMVPATRWIKRLGQELAPLQAAKGGPIVLVQVENEYGSFGDDHEYMERNKQMLLDAGFTSTQLYTADPPNDLAKGSLSELPVGMNFDGTKVDEAKKAYAKLQTLRPDSLHFNSEFWSGWFDHWGGPHARKDDQVQADNLAWELAQGGSISLYMFHGGTDFGWMNGANVSGKQNEYQPDVTSYDYDAALDESGRPTPKYFLFRDVIAKATGITPPPVPKVADPIEIPEIKLVQASPLWGNLPKPILADHPLAMEDIGQSYGYMLYRTRAGNDSGQMVIHDYAQIFVDGEKTPSDTIDRRTMPVVYSWLGEGTGSTQLDILVENMGRINYSHELQHDRKGIVSWKAPAANPKMTWSTYSLPLTGATNPARFRYAAEPCTGPCFYRASFTVTDPADTFLDTTALGKGEVWVNGHALGRFWSVGPQKTLYLPGPWLKRGVNDIIVFDLNGKPGETVKGLNHPDLGPVLHE
jgi:beta-galactosidase